MSFLTKFYGKNFRLNARYNRAHERLDCFVTGEIFFVERGFRVEGIIDQISIGGARFRPTYTHILRRAGDHVRISFLNFNLDAILVNTTIKGYGLKLDRVLTSAEFAQILNDAEHQDVALDPR